MEETRKLTIDRIRAYHKEYYRPENLAIIVTGQLDERQVDLLMSSIRKYEEKLLAKKLPPMVRNTIFTFSNFVAYSSGVSSLF